MSSYQHSNLKIILIKLNSRKMKKNHISLECKINLIGQNQKTISEDNIITIKNKLS